jgi:hypothetical protein
MNIPNSNCNNTQESEQLIEKNTIVNDKYPRLLKKSDYTLTKRGGRNSKKI